MSSLSIIDSLRGAHVLITGATGFLGKCVVEKILRSIPEVGRVYLLVRPRKGSTATQRMTDEIVNSPIFRVLKEKLTEQGFKELADSKLQAMAGELTQSEVGLSEEDLKTLYQNMTHVIHCAAVVDFNERIDRALELNTRGSLRLMEIAKRSPKVKCFVHVSTAYVNCTQFGWIEEKVYPLGFDPEERMRTILKMGDSELEKMGVTDLTGAYPNTYTYTKAMTEELLSRHRGHIPLAIVRPSIIGSAHREPEPGWIDAISAMAALALSVSLGVVHFMQGSIETVGDVIPVDYVVHSILAAIPSMENQDRVVVTHSAGSVEKPMRWTVPTTGFVEHFQKQPPKQNIGPIWYKWIPTPQMYQIEFFLRYSVPSALLNSIALVGGPKQKHLASQMNKLVWKARVLTEVFRHFVTNQWHFDNKNNRAHWEALNPEERDIFDMDLSRVDWYDYFWVFAYGIHKFLLHEEAVPITEASLSKRIGLLSHNEYEMARTRSWLQQQFSDVDWVADKYLTRPAFPAGRPVTEMHSLIISSPEVQAAIDQHVAAHPKLSRDDGVKEAQRIIQKMAGNTKMSTLTPLAWVFRKIWRRLYEEVSVDRIGLAEVKKAAAAGPIIFLPTHRSYVDFLVVTYLCLACELPMPYIAAGEDFLGIALVRTLFRNSGAFFIRRSFMDDPLYATIFKRYVEQVLSDGQSLEFFLEGTRSRSGKMLQPKLGLLSVITSGFLRGKFGNVTVVPLAINYEKTVEGPLFSNELQGEGKIRESLRGLLNASSVLKFNFGNVSVKFGRILTMRDYLAQQTPLGIEPEAHAETLVKNTDLNREFNRKLAHELIFDMSRNTQCMTSHLVATLLLMYRQGVTKAQLVENVHWVRKEVERRGGTVLFFEGNNSEYIVSNAIRHLGSLVVERRQGVFEPNIAGRDEYKNMLALGHYRNNIVHLFFRESLWACALYAFGGRSHHGVERGALLEEVKFLYSLLNREFIIKIDPLEPEDFDATLAQMIDHGVLQLTQDDNLIEVAPTGETHFSFLCALLWPFIDSYYVATLSLFSLQPLRQVDESAVLQKTQALATTLYHEHMLCFYESCSKETLSNAFATLRGWKVFEIVHIKRDRKKVRQVRLLPPYHERQALHKLADHMDRLRKPPAVRKSHAGADGLHRNLIADVPILAKL